MALREKLFSAATGSKKERKEGAKKECIRNEGAKA
jgi:hypothetical protein